MWRRAELLESMPPYQGGGEMIETVRLDDSTYAPPPTRFEVGSCPSSPLRSPWALPAGGWWLMRCSWGPCMLYLTQLNLSQLELDQCPMVSSSTGWACMRTCPAQQIPGGLRAAASSGWQHCESHSQSCRVSGHGHVQAQP